MARGDYNEAVAVFGAPGMGKSYWIEHYLMSRLGDSYIIAYDPMHTYRHCREVYRHRAPQQLLQALSKTPRGIHCLDYCNEEEIMKTVLSVANGVQRVGKETPVLFVIDECVGFDGMSPMKISPVLKKMFLWRRHRGIGFVFGSQRPQAVHPTFYDSCTEMILFRITNGDAQKRLREYGAPQEVVDQIGTLPKYKFLKVVPGQIAGDNVSGEESESDKGTNPPEDVPPDDEPDLPETEDDEES